MNYQSTKGEVVGKGIRGLLFLSLVFAVAGCSTISKTAKEQLSKDADCSTAQRDIQILQKERASVAKQTLSGVRMVLPAAAVIGLLSGDYKNRVRVATGKYNQDIDAKIKEIRDTCGVK